MTLTWCKRQEKQCSEENSHILWYLFHVGPDVFYLLTFLHFFQTWKTSRHTGEALFQSVKVKEWFCYAAHHHIQEVKTSWLLTSHFAKEWTEILMLVICSDWFLRYRLLKVWSVWVWYSFSDATYDLVITTFQLPLWGILVLLRCDQSWLGHDGDSLTASILPLLWLEQCQCHHYFFSR